MNSKIALYLSSKADGETRYQFFSAVEQLRIVLKTGIRKPKNDDGSWIGIGSVENWDVLGNVAWISVYEEEHILSCKMLARLFLERHKVGDKYEIVVNPKYGLK